MKKFFKTVSFFIVLVSLTFLSCDEEKFLTELDFDSETFYANKAKWEECKPSDYKFSYTVYVKDDSMGYRMKITSIIKNNEWKEFENEVNSELVEYESPNPYIKSNIEEMSIRTIDDYINYLEKFYKELNAIDFEKEQLDLYELKYFYHRDYFFPTSYAIKKSGKNISDIPMYIPIGESVFLWDGIYDFQVLPSEQTK